MAKKTLAGPNTPRFWKSSRVSFRMGDDLRAALDFLASKDRRTVSQYLEIAAIDIVRSKLVNEFNDRGELLGSREFKLRS
jgi:predicted transcriptional regulator